MNDFNICLLTDSYKLWHHKGYMPNTKHVYSYMESRTGAKFNKTVFFGLQYILKKYFEGVVVTEEKIKEAKELVDFHIDNTVFNEEGWRYILEKHGGKLPVKIKAVPEGTPVDVSNVMLTIENTDPEVPWLTNYLETLLLQVWYPSAVATLSREIKIMLADYLDKTAENKNGISFMLHDFGFRGTTSLEQASIGGAAHLINFLGTDTVPALLIPNKYYHNEGCAGYSVQATEHSIMTARGKEGEFAVLKHVFDTTPTGVLSLVIDSYDYENFLEQCGTTFKQTIDARDGRTVFRPDSGDPVTVTLRCLEILEKYWTPRTNSKGYKVLPDNIRILWGDGIDYDGIRAILFAMKNNRWSAENIVFGMGGGLLQKVNRDTQRSAFKCSAQMYDNTWHDVYKEPKDLTKRSKRGILALVKTADDNFATVRANGIVPDKDQLQTVFLNGELTVDHKWEDIVKRAKI